MEKNDLSSLDICLFNVDKTNHAPASAFWQIDGTFYNSAYADDITVWQQHEAKSVLMLSYQICYLFWHQVPNVEASA